jgi:hypothetical protein
MNAASRTMFKVPVIGWMVKDALFGAPDAKYYFAANLAVLFVMMTLSFGYAFVIIFALSATAVGMATLVILTAGDMFDQMIRPTSNGVRRPR